MHTRARVAGLQVDTLHLTVERIGSACRGLRSSVYANLESLAVTHVACEDDVQVQAAPCTMGFILALHCVPSRRRRPVWCVRRRTGADTGGSGPPGARGRDRISAREVPHLVQAPASQRGTDACSHGGWCQCPPGRLACVHSKLIWRCWGRMCWQWWALRTRRGCGTCKYRPRQRRRAATRGPSWWAAAARTRTCVSWPGWPWTRASRCASTCCATCLRCQASRCPRACSAPWTHT